jgi:Fe-S oxidoreductase
MSTREGSLEAPQRHPIDWRNPQFYENAALEQDLERVFDVCHGCRRCFNLCTAFPSLFDLVDESPTGELDGVDKAKFGDVVDQCYLCDMCFMTKCPYVPPHPLNIDFPHLMLRAKAVKFRDGKVKLRDKLLSSTDALGKLAAIPVVAQTVNLVNRNPAARAGLEAVLGVHRQRELPTYTPRRFRSSAKPKSAAVKPGERTPGKVAIYATCYVNFNEPGIGHALLSVLNHNAIDLVLVRDESCCGMPKLELGDLESVEALKQRNLPAMHEVAEAGYAILTPIPSCTLMYKQELPLLFPDDAAVKAVAEAMFDPFEYFVLRHRDGLLNTDFKVPLGKVSYHVPCHLRVQNLGLKTRDLLQMIPSTTVETVERCAGHDGTWGVKVEYFDASMKIGRPVFKQMAAIEPDFLSSDCPIAGRHIQQGIGQREAVKLHPIELLARAYGLAEE